VDFYAILGVTPTASPNALREAYTRLAKQFHPDIHPDQPEFGERFKSITEAYAVLRNPSSRAKYDRLRLKAQKAKAAASSTKEPAKKTPKPPNAAQPSSAAQPKTARPATNPKPNPKPGPNTSQNTGPKTATRPNPGQPQAAPKPPPQPKPKPQPRPAPTEEKGPDKVESFLTRLLKSREGKDSLGQIQEELHKAGLGVSGERLSRQDPQKKPGFFAKAKDAAKKLFKAEPALSTYDIVYRLAISRQAATTGTTISINYPRDNNQTQRLDIHIPPGVKDQSQLRLAGQGHLRPGQTRGDLVLTLTVMG
jgi:curved DNA-binding protein CbpA